MCIILELVRNQAARWGYRRVGEVSRIEGLGYLHVGRIYL